MNRWCWCIVGSALFMTGCGAPDDPKAKSVAQWAIEQGGSVKLVGSDLTYDTLEELPEDDYAIRSIDLNDQRVSDADMEQLTELTSLETLNLHSTDVTDEGLKQIAKIKTLTSLELSYTNISDEGLQSLKALDELERLYLYGVPVSDEAIEEFQKSRPGCTIMRD